MSAPNIAVPTATLEQADLVFRRWFGEGYDLEVMHAAVSTAATQQLAGNPVWLLLVGGPGSAKTETLQALSHTAEVASTITSDGALLSGSSKRETAETATGGLLPKLGANGLLVLKDVTSILSMHREARAAVLAALREVYDGRWSRNLGVDGGKTLTWEGRLTLLGGVTTAWDEHHAVVASMGDRFVVFRNNSNEGRREAGRQAMANAGLEREMRSELAEVLDAVLRQVRDEPGELTPEEQDQLLAAADVVTRARTAVIRDFKGDIVDAHMPEAPTRFLKQLVQLMRGGLAIGMDRTSALHMALRGARDSVPPLRLAILEDLSRYPRASVRDVRQRLDRPRQTIDRELQALHMLQLVSVDETEVFELAGREATRWRYELVQGVDVAALRLPGAGPQPIDPDSPPVPEKSSYGVFEKLIGGDSDVSGTVEIANSTTPCPACSRQLPITRLPRQCLACGWAA